MNISLRIDYVSHGNKVYQATDLQLRGRPSVEVAYHWWKQIKKDMSYFAELEKVTLNGEQDITQEVKDFEKQEIRRIMNDDLPF